MIQLAQLVTKKKTGNRYLIVELNLEEKAVE